MEMDIFIKTIYQFGLFISGSSNYNPEISYFVLETGLFDALEGYFIDQEIQNIIL